MRRRQVQLAVNGCRSNCAESASRDVGVIGVDSGWEMHLAAGAQDRIRAFFRQGEDAEEVIGTRANFWSGTARKPITGRAPFFRAARGIDYVNSA